MKTDTYTMATALQSKKRKGFVPLITERLKVMYTEHTAKMDDQQIGNLVKRGKRKAKKYLIESDQDIQRFIEALLVLGDQTVENEKPYVEIINNDDLSGTEKMDRVEEQILFQD